MWQSTHWACRGWLALVAFAVHAAPAAAEPDAVKLYGDHCAQCHGADRLGQLGRRRLDGHALPTHRQLRIAVRRQHWWNATLTVIGLNAALASLYFASKVGPQAVTPLLMVDGYALFYMAMIL